MARTGKVTSTYNALLGEIKERIQSAQYEALKTVNKGLIALYWDIGRMIVERQKDKGWGKSVVQRLASDLQKDFPGIQGFSAQNLWYMRQLFLEYSDKPKPQPLVGEISWTKNLVIMGSCKTELEREFYIRMTKKFGWSKNVLIHHIENQSYDSLDHVNETGTLFCSLLSLRFLTLARLHLRSIFELNPAFRQRRLA
jgi:predicted nuclease of restriction endonuclease-like (RecB) superfamily